MEKEFVSYNQALALKELGFDWETYEYYDSHTKEICDIFRSVRAPLKQQVFRWFREKYNFDIPYIQKLRKLGVVFYYCQVPNTDISFRATSYEEAENACINKLIELVK